MYTVSGVLLRVCLEQCKRNVSKAILSFLNSDARRRGGGGGGAFSIKVLFTIYVFLIDVTPPTDSCDIRASETLLFWTRHEESGRRKWLGHIDLIQHRPDFFFCLFVYFHSFCRLPCSHFLIVCVRKLSHQKSARLFGVKRETAHKQLETRRISISIERHQAQRETVSGETPHWATFWNQLAFLWHIWRTARSG